MKREPRRYLPTHPLANAGGCVAVHRLIAWEAGILTEPTMEVHHLDGNHLNNALSNLVAVTHDEHARLHDRPGEYQRKKTHCPQGHPYDEANTYVTPSGSRQCKTCRFERQRARLERLKALVPA